MKLETKIKSIEAEIQDNKIFIRSKKPLKILSSAILNGGFREINCIMNFQVTEDAGSDLDDEVHKDARDFLIEEAKKIGIPQDQIVAIMTAAKMKNVEISTQIVDDITLTTLVTAGVYFAATPGDKIASKQNAFLPNKWGTINTIVLIDGNLTESCMVNAIVSATEAKASALRELDVRSRFSGEIATGTVTDSIIIACTKNGSPIKYAGSGTIIGEMIGKTVNATLKKALYKQEKLVSNRLLTKRLEERGITIENLTTLFSQIRPLLRENPDKRKLFTTKLKEILFDANIASLIIAGIRLDEDAKNDLIPVDPKNKKHQNFLLHKILQKATTDYMLKKEFTIKYVRPDFLSSTFSESMGWFTRSVLSSIMYSTYSNIIQD